MNSLETLGRRQIKYFSTSASMTPIWTDFYHVLQLLIPTKALYRKTIQMLTGKTAFPYRSYQRSSTISLFCWYSAWQQNTRCSRDTGEGTNPATEFFSSVLCLTLVNSSFFFFFKGPDSLFIDVSWMTSIDFSGHCISP